MDAKFSIETHQYRSGAKPLEIANLKTCKTRWKVVSVDPMGCTQLHDEHGYFNSSSQESEHDLVPIPTKLEAAYWSKPEDVPGDAEWIIGNDFDGPRRICGVDAAGIRTVARHDSWGYLKALDAKWSPFRLGVYKPCTTTSEANR